MRPGHGAAFNAVDQHYQFAKRPFVSLSYFVRPCEVVELRDRVGGQPARLREPGSCGGQDSGCRSARSGDMVRVAVNAVLIERDDDMRPDAPDVSDKLLHERSLFRLVEFAVVVIKEVDLAP